MKNFNWRKLLLSVLLFVLGLFILSVFKEDVKELNRHLKIITSGENEYVAKQLSKQYPGKERMAANVRDIETSVLPIKLTFTHLNETVDFALEGGSLAVGEGYFLIADRIGNIYVKKSNAIRKIKTPNINNNIKQFILNAKDELGSGQMRVHSIAFNNRDESLYICYTKFVNKGARQLVIDRIKIDVAAEASVGNWEGVYESQFVPSSQSSVSAGGKLLLNGNDLYFSVGYPNSIGYSGEAKDSDWYTEDANQVNSQNIKSSFGKIFKLNVATKELRQISMGHRNVTGLTLAAKGQLYSVEHGPQGGDELNLIEAGRNYGWPLKTYGTRYGTYGYDWKTSVSESRQKESFTEPVFAFVPSVATSAVVAIKNFNERWNNDLLIASLKGQSLYRIHLSKSGNAIYSEPIWIGSRLRDVGISEPGVIHILTDDGQLIAMTVDVAALAKNTKSNGLHFEKELKVCQTCHGFEATSPSSMAPSLSAIVNRKIGTDSFSKYSEAMKNKEGNWTQENLIKFLIDPQAFVPGTSMPKLGLSESEAKKIVSILNSK